MGALELTKIYWEQTAGPRFQRDFPELYDRAAVGLVGNGSECFGYDDSLSRDHDWGVDFYIWLAESDRGQIPQVRRWKEQLLAEQPPPFVRRQSAYGGRPAVMCTGDFYTSLIGLDRAPATLEEWRMVPEENFALAVNGAVFRDGPGEFSMIRAGLRAYYPEDLRRKKIAARCMAIAQTGQYNYMRTVDRGDLVTLNQILARFTAEVMGLVYHLNREYRPYYKWTWRRLRELPVLGERISQTLLALNRPGPGAETEARQRLMEEICGLLCLEMVRSGLSSSPDSFLASHGKAVQETIRDDYLRSLPLQYE